MAEMRDPKTCNSEAFRKFGVAELKVIAKRTFYGYVTLGREAGQSFSLDMGVIWGKYLKAFQNNILTFAN